jgi:hypothetical protein
MSSIKEVQGTPPSPPYAPPPAPPRLPPPPPPPLPLPNASPLVLDQAQEVKPLLVVGGPSADEAHSWDIGCTKLDVLQQQ